MGNRITWILAAIIIALSCLMNCQNKQYKESKRLSKIMENTLSLINQKAELKNIQLNDSLQVKQAEVQSLQVTNKNLESLYDNLLKATKTKPKDVNSIAEISSVTSGRDTTICLVDSFGGLKANWNDKYINIQVDIDSTRKAIIDYSVRDSLTVISYQKRHSILFGLIKWNSYEGCRVITHNPKATPVTVIQYNNIKH